MFSQGSGSRGLIRTQRQGRPQKSQRTLERVGVQVQLGVERSKLLQYVKYSFQFHPCAAVLGRIHCFLGPIFFLELNFFLALTCIFLNNLFYLIISLLASFRHVLLPPLPSPLITKNHKIRAIKEYITWFCRHNDIHSDHFFTKNHD